MATAYDNIVSIVAHPDLGTPVYAASLAAMVPAALWATEPMSILGGIGVATASLLYVENWLPFSPTYIKGALILGAGISIGCGLKNMVVAPLQLPPANDDEFDSGPSNFCGIHIGRNGIFVGARSRR